MGVSHDPAWRILVVDDEGSIRHLLSRFLRGRGFSADEAPSGNDALEALSRGRYDLVLSDVNMPGMNGLSLLAEIRRHHPDTPVLMLTGCEDVSMAVGAMKTGAVDYVLKPVDFSKLEHSIRDAVGRHSEIRLQANYLAQLEKTVQEQTAELRSLVGHLNIASESTLGALVAALDAREHETRAHSRRVAEYAVYLAGRMNVAGDSLETIRRGALLHDIGKIGISDNILLKPSSLTEREWREMHRHPQIGYWILSAVESLRPAAEIVLAHHERYDGTGYPRKLSGPDIPLGARIFSVVDSFDAITSDRPYKSGKSYQAAREEVHQNSGGQFDPSVVDAFLKITPDVWSSIRDRVLSESSSAAPDLPHWVLQCRSSNQ